MTDTSKEAVEARSQLTNFQKQLDADGVMVGVSRQALDKTLAAFIALQTRVAELETASNSVEVSILTMRLSGDREEYYTRIIRDGRTFDVRKYGQDFRNRAEYECAELRHVLLGEPKPDLMDEKYADTGPTPPAKEE